MRYVTMLTLLICLAAPGWAGSVTVEPTQREIIDRFEIKLALEQIARERALFEKEKLKTLREIAVYARSKADHVTATIVVPSADRPLRYVLVKMGEPNMHIVTLLKKAQIELPLLHDAGFDMVAGGPCISWLFSTRLSPSEADSVLRRLQR